MQRLVSVSRSTRRIAGLLAAALGVLAPLEAVRAVDLLGLYVGGSIGEAQVQADPSRFFGNVSSGQFSHSNAAYKVMAGLRPISLVGAEVEYLDLGHPRGAANGFGLGTVDVSTKGFAAFGVLYLPVPIIDVFLKAGLDRMDSNVNFNGCGVDVCQPQSAHPHDTGFAAGAGVQYKLGSWAARAEYERFGAAGGNPYMYSFGLTWQFL